jgi:hypothetical protein
MSEAGVGEETGHRAQNGTGFCFKNLKWQNLLTAFYHFEEKSRRQPCFTLDETALNTCGMRPQDRPCPRESEIVREAIIEFHRRVGRLSERERSSMLRAFDELVPQIPVRPATAVDRELAQLGVARRTGGRRTAPSS